MSEQNQPLLKEVNAAHSWFAAVKIAPLWARPNQGETAVPSIEGMTASHAGDMICRGSKGETWTQGAEKFHSKYTPTGNKDADGFEKYLPKPEGARVMAAKIARPFEVISNRGLLSGQPGDYLIKSFEDRDRDFPDSVWIVAAAIFEETYARL